MLCKLLEARARITELEAEIGRLKGNTNTRKFPLPPKRRRRRSSGPKQ
jgi:hypothetical protein